MKKQNKSFIVYSKIVKKIPAKQGRTKLVLACGHIITRVLRTDLSYTPKSVKCGMCRIMNEHISNEMEKPESERKIPRRPTRGLPTTAGYYLHYYGSRWHVVRVFPHFDLPERLMFETSAGEIGSVCATLADNWTGPYCRTKKPF